MQHNSPVPVNSQSLPARGPGSGACGNSTCVDAKRLGPDAIEFTSTIDGNDGAVTYTQGEVTQFFADVKNGKWDHLL